MPSQRFDLRIDSERVLRGRFVPATLGPAPWPCVTMVYGHTSFMDWGFYPELSHRLAAVGIASVRFNYSGDGLGEDLETFENEALFARTGYGWELDDLARVRAYTLEHPEIDDRRCAVLGHSRGGGMALLHAAECGDYRAVITWNAIDEVLRFSSERLAEWEENGQIRVQHWTAGRRARKDVSVLRHARTHAQRFDIPSACGRLQCPTLILQAADDRSVPESAAHAIASACPPGLARVQVIPDADHVFGGRHPLREIPASLSAALDATVNFALDQLG